MVSSFLALCLLYVSFAALLASPALSKLKTALIRIAQLTITISITVAFQFVLLDTILIQLKDSVLLVQRVAKLALIQALTLVILV